MVLMSPYALHSWRREVYLVARKKIGADTKMLVRTILFFVREFEISFLQKKGMRILEHET